MTIPLSTEKRSHLILTGKNGSGKTGLLLEMNKILLQLDSGRLSNLSKHEDRLASLRKNFDRPEMTDKDKSIYARDIEGVLKKISLYGGVRLKFSNEVEMIENKCREGKFLLAYFDSKRQTNLSVPQGINKLNLKKKYSLQEKANTSFIQYLVNLKADRSFARDDQEMETVHKIDNWFSRLEKRLQQLFDDENLRLKFNRKDYNFDIQDANENVFNFNTLSDGYSAIISIVSELLLRMEAHKTKTYDLEGIVIIDEIETHLHVDLQKNILPFLIDFFPHIQFIVTTHSPFIISSVSNAIICDLETRIVTADLSNYSYDALIESYFKTDKYSEELKEKVFKFERLVEQKERSPKEEADLLKLREYFSNYPKFLANELTVKLQEITLKELNMKY